MRIRRFFVSILCAFIPWEKLRRRVRVLLNNPTIHTYVKFVRKWANANCGGVKKLKINFGVGCRNLVVNLNDAHIFKFPLSGNGAVAVRETCICNALRSVCPIYMPAMELIRWRGMIVRRYEYIDGKLLCDFPVSRIIENRDRIARQLAEFIYFIGCADPESIREYKPVPDATPGFLYGWFHNDIGQNFLMDDDFNIVGFIDWEGASFCDFRITMRGVESFWNRNGYRGLMTDVLSYYSRLFYSEQ